MSEKMKRYPIMLWDEALDLATPILKNVVDLLAAKRLSGN